MAEFCIALDVHANCSDDEIMQIMADLIDKINRTVNCSIQGSNFKKVLA